MERFEYANFKITHYERVKVIEALSKSKSITTLKFNLRGFTIDFDYSHVVSILECLAKMEKIQNI